MPLGPSALTQINTAIQAGRGAAASVLGDLYSVYRLTNATNTAVVSGSPVISQFQAVLEKASKKDMEQQIFDLQIFKATCDNRILQDQDVLVGTGFDNATYVFCQARKMRHSLLARTEFTASITRPMPTAGSAAEHQLTG
jgi:hypothetical protein